MNPKKLDVIAAISEAYRGAWTHAGEMIRLIWLPGLIYIGLSVAAALIDLRKQVGLGMLIQAASLFLWPIIAVAWHRFILIGDAATGAFQLRFGRREARFFLVSIFLVLLFMPGFIIVSMVAALNDPAHAMTASLVSFLGLILVMVGIYYFIRLSLLLPAVAVDEPVNARLVLERTRGNFWRLVALYVLGGLPVIVLFWGIAMLLATAHVPAVVPFALYALIYIFFAIVNVAILSIAYRELIGPAGTLALDLDDSDSATLN